MNSESTVFWVDDDDRVLKSYAVLLRSFRLRVETYESASDFLDRYDPARPGCLVLDVRMPHMSGLELHERLSTARPRLPVVFLTGYADMHTAVRSMKLGAYDFLQKGCSETELLTSIQRAVGDDRQNRQRAARQADLLARMQRLSEGESQVLKLVLAGEPNKNIAARLGVSRRCVEDRRVSLMTKLQADSLPELARIAFECEHTR